MNSNFFNIDPPNTKDPENQEYEEITNNVLNMDIFNQETFDNFILKSDIIGFFKDPITTKSGRLSHWYVNWRNVAVH